jgi:hypothetical protein
MIPDTSGLPRRETANVKKAESHKPKASTEYSCKQQALSCKLIQNTAALNTVREL